MPTVTLCGFHILEFLQLPLDREKDGWSPINECINVDKVVAATQIYALASIDLLEAKVF